MIPPVYKTNRFTLQPYLSKDEDLFVEMGIDSQSVRFMGGANGIEEEERAMFKKIFEVYQRTDKRWFWIWGIYQDQTFCGHLELKESVHTTPEELEIVYMIHPKHRKKGVMTEIFAFLKSNQHTWKRRIIATISPENIHSMALVQKWGIDQKEELTNEETGKSYFKFILTE